MHVIPAVQFKTDFTTLYHGTVRTSYTNAVIPTSKYIGDRHAVRSKAIT